MTPRRRHASCPTCSCDSQNPVMNIHAPFYGLVIEADRLIWDGYRKARRDDDEGENP